MADGPPRFIQRMTRPGKLLLILTVVGVAFGIAGFFLAVVDDLPPGRYPVVLFVIPVLLGAALFFAVAALVLRLFGVRVFRPDEVAAGDVDAT